MDVEDPYIKPRWLSSFADFVRPGGVALMFCFITILPLLFSIIDLGIKGAGTRLAGVLAGYFQAIPDIYYTTLQVLFIGYVAGKSGEVIAGKIRSGSPDVTIPSQSTQVNMGGPSDGAQG